jgi:hypothetical protein
MRGLWALSVLASIVILGLSGAFGEAYADDLVAITNGFYDSASTWRNDSDPNGHTIPLPGDNKGIPNGITVTMQNDQINDGRIDNFGTLIIDATLTNNGFFTPPSDTRGIISFGTMTITSNGEIQNNGLIDNIFGATMTIDGKIDNNFAGGNGHFHNEAATITVNGRLNNFADIHQLTNGIMTISATGIFVTSGVNAVTDNRPGSTINNNSNELRVESGGIIINSGSSNINNLSGGKIELTANINNNGGTITNFNGATLDISFGGVINNNQFGTIANTGGIIIHEGGTIKNNNGANLNNNGLGNLNLLNGGTLDNLSGGTITNNFGGTIFLDTDFNQNEPGNPKLNNSGILVNMDGGTINRDDEFGELNNLSGGSISNFGLISCDFCSNSLFTNSGIFTNQPSGVVDEISAFENLPGGILNNFGTFFISGGVQANPFTNTGTINNNPGGTFNIAKPSGGSSSLENLSGGIIDNGGSLNVYNRFSRIQNTGGTINNLSGGEIILHPPDDLDDPGAHILNWMDGEFNNLSGSKIIIHKKSFLSLAGNGEFTNFPGAMMIFMPTSAFTSNLNTPFINQGTVDISTEHFIAIGTTINRSTGTINILSGGIFQNVDSALNEGFTNNEGIINIFMGGTFINNFANFVPNGLDNTGTIVNCGTYTGPPPTGNPVSPCQDTTPPEIDPFNPQTHTISGTTTGIGFNENVDGTFIAANFEVESCGAATDIFPSGPQIGVSSIILTHCDLADPAATPVISYLGGDLQDQADTPNLMEPQTITAPDGIAPSFPGGCTIFSNNQFDSTLATIGDIITVECNADEDLSVPPLVDVQLNRRPVDAVNILTTSILATQAVMGGDPQGNVELDILLSDAAGNPGPPLTEADLSGPNVVVDTNGLAVDTFTIQSNNPNDNHLAKTGDTLSIFFNANENIMTPVPGDILVFGSPAILMGTTPSGFTAEYTIQDPEPDGPVPIMINFDDGAGNNVMVSEDAITSGGNVIVDNTPPTFVSGTIVGGNSALVNFIESIIAAPADFNNLDVNPSGPPDVRVINSITGSGTTGISINFGGPPVPPGTNGIIDIGPGPTDQAGNPFAPFPGAPLNPGSTTLILDPSSTTVPLTDDTFIEFIDATSVPAPELLLDGLTGGPGTATFPPHPITIETDLGTVTFPPGVTATNLPPDEILEFSLSTKPATGIPGDPGFIFEVGDPDVDIFFDAPPRILIPNKAGGIPFFIPASGITTEITTVCPADDITLVTPLIIPGPPNECSLDVGSDKVIYSNHFTGFGAGGGGASTADSGKGSTSSQKITLGKLKNGVMAVHGGFCFNLYCIDVIEYFNHLKLQYVDSNESFTITLTGYFPNGANRANYASIGAAPPGGDINDSIWNVMAKRVGATDKWDMIIKDKDGNLGSVTVSVQKVDNNIVAFTFTIQSHTPASIGTPEGDTEPLEDNLILVTELRDNRGSSVRNIFNEGFFVDDIYAYPEVQAFYDSPLEYEKLCLNEDETDRYTCAFEMVRQWTIKQAEERLKEIYDENNLDMDSYDESEQYK